MINSKRMGSAIRAPVRTVDISCDNPIPDTSSINAERKPVNASKMMSAAEAVTILPAPIFSSLYNKDRLDIYQTKPGMCLGSAERLKILKFVWKGSRIPIVRSKVCQENAVGSIPVG